MEPTWLNSLIVEAGDNRWCTRIGCTTCGASEFRNRVFTDAIELAGIDVPDFARMTSRRLLDTLSPTQRAPVFEEIVKGLRGVRSAGAPGLSALRLVIHDLEPPFMKWGVAASLSERLEGTVAGEVLASMKSHSAELSEMRARQTEYESPQAVERRREEWRAKGEVQRRQHLERKAARDLVRDRVLNELAALSPTKRLLAIATHDQRTPLDAVPDDLVPLDADLQSLSEETRTQLVAQIGKRRGAWGQLRRQLIALSS